MDLFDALETPIVFTDVEAAAVALEACETPRWAAQAGIGCADLQHRVLDPCVGRGVLAETAIAAGHDVRSGDIYGWEYDGPRLLCDFLSPRARGKSPRCPASKTHCRKTRSVVVTGDIKGKSDD